jgi:hypothetical protein
MNITSNLTDNPKRPIIQAIEDSLTVFLFTMFSALIALGWPPTAESCYVPMLSAGLIGIVTYMRARNISSGD